MRSLEEGGCHVSRDAAEGRWRGYDLVAAAESHEENLLEKRGDELVSHGGDILEQVSALVCLEPVDRRDWFRQYRLVAVYGRWKPT